MAVSTADGHRCFALELLGERRKYLIDTWVHHRGLTHGDGRDHLIATSYRSHEGGSVGLVPDVALLKRQFVANKLTLKGCAEPATRPPIHRDCFRGHVHSRYKPTIKSRQRQSGL